MRQFVTILIIMVTILGPSGMAYAEIPPVSGQAKELSVAERALLARQFISRIAKKFADVDKEQEYKNNPVAAQISNFAEGEELLLSIRLINQITLEAPVTARIENKELLVSLRDFILALEFPIDVNIENKTAVGWYIRENKTFSLDATAKKVVTTHGTYPMSDKVKLEKNDILVPPNELAAWFGLGLKPNIGSLELILETSQSLPVEERLARKDLTIGDHSQDLPVQPRLEDTNPAREFPLVDVSTITTYSKPGKVEEFSNKREGLAASAFVRTSGDLAGGTFTTQSAFDDKEDFTNLRATFSEQSLEPELLGPLKARKYELGDINTPYIPLSNRAKSGIGARVTNAPANGSTLRPTTEIRGTSFPNWDVELYRGNQLLDVQTIGEDGVYAFENVDLFGNENDFRVVFYGPQGEHREEEVSIPVDTRRLSEFGSAYDVSVMAQNKQTYRKFESKDEDEGASAISAIYEVPIGENSAASVAFEAGQDEGKKRYIGHAGISSSVAGTLLNLDTAIDQDNEMAAQFVARRNIGDHKLRNEFRLNTDKYNITNDLGENATVISNRFNVTGPLPFELGGRTRYNTQLAYGFDPDGNLSQGYQLGISTNLLSRISLNQQLYYDTDEAEEEDKAGTTTTLTGSLGKNRLRLIGNYQLKPENKLINLEADYTRDLAEDLDFNLNVTHHNDEALTEGRAQLNWRAGWADISPSISYNSDEDMVAMLNTRFGITRDPLSTDIKSFDTPITANGGISVFVFLDKNGDNIFNEGEEPIPDATIVAPQNGGRQVTDESGHAFFNRVLNMRPTDIYVQEDTLADPYWISGYEGFSIVPREGHVVQVEFPVHVGGEIDGSVYLKTANGEQNPLRGVSLSLFDLKGKKIKTVVSEPDGFYLIEKVPPGRYMLVVDNKKFEGKFSRPKPQPILVKSIGSTMYGNNIYLREGGADVPVTFHADASDLKIDPSTLHGRSMFLNLGQYKSRLSMGLAWLKIRNQFKRELGDMEIMELPSESSPDLKTQVYTLRVLAYSDDMSEAYNKCKVLAANGQDCAVEVVPEQAPERVATQDTTAAASP